MSSNKLQESADEKLLWCDKNKMKINGQKTKEMVINFAQSSEHIPTLEIGGEKIEKVSHTKLLGVTICDNLSWDAHISSITAKASQRLYFLRILKGANISMDKFLSIYCSLVRPVVEYACQVWHGGLSKEQSNSVENIQERALKIIMPDATYELALQVAELPTLASRRLDMCKKLFTEIQDDNHRLHHLLLPIKTHRHNICDGNKYELPKVLSRTRKSFINWCLYNLQ